MISGTTQEHFSNHKLCNSVNSINETTNANCNYLTDVVEPADQEENHLQYAQVVNNEESSRTNRVDIHESQNYTSEISDEEKIMLKLEALQCQGKIMR